MDVVVAIALGAAGAGVTLAIAGRAYLAEWRRLRGSGWPRAPRAAIAQVREGRMVRIVGTVQAGETLRAPLSGRPCVQYFVSVEVPAPGSGLYTIWFEERGLPFVVSDGTGRAFVDPTGARCSYEERTFEAGGTPAHVEFLARRELSRPPPFFFTEGIIAPGATVAVQGSGVREPDPDLRAAEAYRDMPAPRLRMMASPMLYLADTRNAIAGR